jgi:hypothetical protein
MDVDLVEKEKGHSRECPLKFLENVIPDETGG